MSAASGSWEGDYGYLLRNLVLKDFKVRYRNMSLGMIWSIGNPLIMMAVLTFVFTVLLPSGQPRFPVFLLAGLVPFNFFSIGWSIGTVSMIDNAHLIKRVNFPREIIPISAVLANCLHFLIQLTLLIAIALIYRIEVTYYWLYLPSLAFLEVVFVTGLAMLTSAINVYIRDTRYVVESLVTVIFWLVPVVYSFDRIKPPYSAIVRFNPVAAVIMANRNVLLDGRAPANSIVFNMLLISCLSITIGFLGFGRLKRRFYENL